MVFVAMLSPPGDTQGKVAIVKDSVFFLPEGNECLDSGEQYIPELIVIGLQQMSGEHWSLLEQDC